MPTSAGVHILTAPAENLYMGVGYNEPNLPFKPTEVVKTKCDLRDIKADAGTDRAAYHPSEVVTVTTTLAYVGATPCDLVLSACTPTLVIREDSTGQIVSSSPAGSEAACGMRVHGGFLYKPPPPQPPLPPLVVQFRYPAMTCHFGPEASPAACPARPGTYTATVRWGVANQTAVLPIGFTVN